MQPVSLFVRKVQKKATIYSVTAVLTHFKKLIFLINAHKPTL